MITLPTVRRPGPTARTSTSANTLGPVLAVLLMLVLAPAMAFEAPSELDIKCMKCHSKDKTKSLEDGAEMSLNVPSTEYTSSAHSKEGCVSCHKVIANKKHPAKKYRISISNQRDYSVERNEVCRDCHVEKYEQYEGSVHATMVTHGSRTAPVCSDCHSAHAVEPMTVYQPVTGQPCKNCHEDVFDMYSMSVHGEARKNGNVIRDEHIQAPICVDCHRSHDISAIGSSVVMRTLCLDCHTDASLAHEQWLPNASRHLDVVSCASCHAPMVDRRIDLELHDSLVQENQNSSDGEIQQQLAGIDAAGESVGSAELKNILTGDGRQGQAGDVTLHGRMEASSGVDAHRLADKSQAVRSCDSCHKKGVDVFQNVTVSITGSDGRRVHYTADKEILDSLGSVESVSGFYTVGGTRIPLLDALVVLSLFAGIAIPVGHFGMGRIFKRKAKKENNHV
jgi:hypothetical protein